MDSKRQLSSEKQEPESKGGIERQGIPASKFVGIPKKWEFQTVRVWKMKKQAIT